MVGIQGSGGGVLETPFSLQFLYKDTRATEAQNDRGARQRKIRLGPTHLGIHIHLYNRVGSLVLMGPHRIPFVMLIPFFVSLAPPTRNSPRRILPPPLYFSSLVALVLSLSLSRSCFVYSHRETVDQVRPRGRDPQRSRVHFGSPVIRSYIVGEVYVI